MADAGTGLVCGRCEERHLVAEHFHGERPVEEQSGVDIVPVRVGARIAGERAVVGIGDRFVEQVRRGGASAHHELVHAGIKVGTAKFRSEEALTVLAGKTQESKAVGDLVDRHRHHVELRIGHRTGLPGIVPAVAEVELPVGVRTAENVVVASCTLIGTTVLERTVHTDDLIRTEAGEGAGAGRQRSVPGQVHCAATIQNCIQIGRCTVDGVFAKSAPAQGFPRIDTGIVEAEVVPAPRCVAVRLAPGNLPVGRRGNEQTRHEQQGSRKTGRNTHHGPTPA